MDKNPGSGKKTEPELSVIPISKQDDTEFSPLHFRVSPEFHREFKLYAVQHGISMVDLLHQSFHYFKTHTKR